MSSYDLACDCEPEVFDDGSRLHDDSCDLHPWCPHEVVAAACLMPCGCPCGRCTELADAIEADVRTPGGSA